LASVYLELGQSKEAQGVLNVAESTFKIGDEPQSIPVRLSRIHYHVRMGEAGSAASLIKDTEALISAYGLGTRRPLLMARQGELYELMGEYQQAVKLYAELFKAFPS